MIVDINDSGEILERWLEEDLLPKLEKTNFFGADKRTRFLAQAGSLAFLTYNMPTIKTSVNEMLYGFTMGQSTLDLERFALAISTVLDKNGGSLRITEAIPLIDKIMPYTFDKADLEKILEISQRYAKEEEQSKEEQTNGNA